MGYISLLVCACWCVTHLVLGVVEGVGHTHAKILSIHRKPKDLKFPKLMESCHKKKKKSIHKRFSRKEGIQI